MKKGLSCFIIAILLICMTCASGEDHSALIPVALLEAIPDELENYAPVRFCVYEGGNEEKTVGAVIMKNGEHNVVCIFDKEPTQDRFHPILISDKLVYQGDRLPALRLDDHGTVFTIEYESSDGGHEYYSSLYDNYVWGSVCIEIDTILEDGNKARTSIEYENHLFTYHNIAFDNNGNVILDRIEYVPWYGESIFNPNIMGFSIADFPRSYDAAQVLSNNSKAALSLIASIPVEDANIKSVNAFGIEERPIVVLIESVDGGVQEVFIDFFRWISRDDMVVIQDANFDGYSDVMICRSIESSNKVYNYYLWDQQNGCFETISEFNEIEANPHFDVKSHTITCQFLDGAHTLVNSLYSIENGMPILLEEKEEYIMN